jgi:hypothetical protein
MSLASNPVVLYTAIGLCGVIAGPFALRFVLGLAPGGLKERAAKWQLHRALAMGGGWLVHQDGDRSYQLCLTDTDRDTVEVGGEEVSLANLGHISTKTGSVPMGTSYGPGAVDESPLVGVAPGAHVGEAAAETDTTATDDSTDDDDDPVDGDIIFGDDDSEGGETDG